MSTDDNRSIGTERRDADREVGATILGARVRPDVVGRPHAEQPSPMRLSGEFGRCRRATDALRPDRACYYARMNAPAVEGPNQYRSSLHQTSSRRR
jgi:hypothetical protein